MWKIVCACEMSVVDVGWSYEGKEYGERDEIVNILEGAKKGKKRELERLN